METGTKREQQARPKGYSWPVRKDGSAAIRPGKKSALIRFSPKCAVHVCKSVESLKLGELDVVLFQQVIEVGAIFSGDLRGAGRFAVARMQ